MLKILKPRKKSLISKDHKQNSTSQTSRILVYMVLFLILFHNLACIWFLIARYNDFEEDTWVYRYEFVSKPIRAQYLASFYFILTTITTVGYGDISPKNEAEHAFCILVMMIGVFSYSLAIGTFTSLISARN